MFQQLRNDVLDWVSPESDPRKASEHKEVWEVIPKRPERELEKGVRAGKDANTGRGNGQLKLWATETHFSWGASGDGLEHSSEMFHCRIKEAGVLIPQFPTVTGWRPHLGPCGPPHIWDRQARAESYSCYRTRNHGSGYPGKASAKGEEGTTASTRCRQLHLLNNNSLNIYYVLCIQVVVVRD